MPRTGADVYVGNTGIEGDVKGSVFLHETRKRISAAVNIIKIRGKTFKIEKLFRREGGINLTTESVCLSGAFCSEKNSLVCRTRNFLIELVHRGKEPLYPRLSLLQNLDSLLEAHKPTNLGEKP